MHSALNKSAVHWSLIIADQSEMQLFLGVFFSDTGLLSTCVTQQH